LLHRGTLGGTALSVGKIEADLSGEAFDPTWSVAVCEVGVRRVPVPAGGDRGRGALPTQVEQAAPGAVGLGPPP